MSQAIQAESVSKRYALGTSSGFTLKDAVSRRLGRAKTGGEGQSAFWALKEVSFEVEQGESLAIVGRNGAGKSTMLKILSRITHPTDGRVRIHGRVGSLLEVGTGFHPELTGRENVFLNGAILGMTRQETYSKFDQIVDFSGIEAFVDTPVKRYSSGMQMRLAFSVAAHLEPEILLVDEVLAVGDLEFQEKCFGKMGEIEKQGRTVIFISHNLGAVRRLCPRSILLDEGRLVADAATPDVIAQYLQLTNPESGEAQAGGEGSTGWHLTSPGAHGPRAVESGAPCSVIFQYRPQAPAEQCFVIFTIETFDGVLVAHLNSLQASGSFTDLTAEPLEFAFDFAGLPLSEGTYSLHVGVYDRSGARIASWQAQPHLRVVGTPSLTLPIETPVGLVSLDAAFALRQRTGLSP